MIQEVEIIRLLISLAVFIFIILRRKQIFRIPHFSLLVSCYSFLMVGWVVTIVEGFILPELMNTIEHTCYTICSLILAVWCFKVFLIKKEYK